MRRELALAAGLALACCGGAPEPPVPHFPPERGEADFPGIAYPPHEGELPAPDRAGGPTWLVGVDGATWDLIRPMVDRGELPAFASLLREGAHGVLLSEEPTISPALWATIATGMPRFEHGVVNFLEKVPGRPESVESGPPDRRSPALWELVGAAGGRSVVVNWFGSYPAEAISGEYVSKGCDPQAPEASQVHPDELLELLPRIAAPTLEPRDLESIALTDFLRDTLLDDVRAVATLRALVAPDRPRADLVAVYLAGIDVVQHVTWKHAFPESREFTQDGPPDPRLSGVIAAYYRHVDRALGEIRSLAPPGTRLIVVSDHGAGPLRPEQAFHFRLDVLLQRLGLSRAGGLGVALTVSELYRHDKRIWLNLAGVEQGGTVPVDGAAAEASRMARRLRALRADDGGPIFVSVIDHVAEPGWEPGDPALTVRFSGHARVTERARDGDHFLDFSSVRMRHADVSGGHRLEGILMLHGPGIRRGPLPRPANLHQVAPTLLYLLGLPQDARMLRRAPADGGVLEAAITPELLARRPIRAVPEYPGTDRSALLRRRIQVERDPADERALERLRSLGYVQ